MRDLTGIEAAELREAMEAEAVTHLGRMLLEFSRLDMHLGLCACWVDDGAQLDTLTPRIAKMAFEARRVFLSKAVAKKFAPSSEAGKAYATWLAGAAEARLLRNRLVHGRWGVEPHTGHVVNVVGLPTSPDQHSQPFTLKELAAHVDHLQQLQFELARLRKLWPL